MKLLAIGTQHHDHNAAYFDGEKLHYHKFERTKQIKHFEYENRWEIFKDVQELWNFKLDEIDDIVIDYDYVPFFQNIEPEFDLTRPEVLFYRIPKKYNPFESFGIKNAWHISHHYSHALSTWMLEDKDHSPRVRIVIDGMGNNKTCTVFENNVVIKSVYEADAGSIGFHMNNAAMWLGVNKVSSLDNAGKVMGLQSYGRVHDQYLKEINEFGIDNANAIFDLTRWNNYMKDPLLTNLTPLDWIRTVHERVGDLLVELFSKYVNKEESVSYSGGVAQNVVWNTKLIHNFPNIIIPPHSSDEGCSLGAIEWLRKYHDLPEFKLENFPYCQNDYAPSTEPTDETIKYAAKMLAENKIVGWYQGHGEVGPRALGHRSILMNPAIPLGKEIINSVKKRENYRPFGASVLSEHVLDYFKYDIKDPHMLFTNDFKVDTFPAITHVDGTCRTQTVENDGSAYRKLIEEFYKLTGHALILNTSLNINGKPIAGYPENAIDLFEFSMIDCMIIGNTILNK